MDDLMDKSLDRLSDGLLEMCKWKEALLDHRHGLYTLHLPSVTISFRD